MILLIENDQALYKGPYHNWPTEIWNVRLQKWEPYKGAVPKEIGWGNVVTADEADAFRGRF